MEDISMAAGYEFSDGQTASHLPHQRAFRKRVISLLEEAGVTRDCCGIEIGPGLGEFTNYMISQGFAVKVVEPSKDAVKLIKKNFPHINIIEIPPYTAIPRTDRETFFYALEVIEHCFDPQLFLEVINASMKKGEVLIISTPYHGYFKNLLISILDGWDKHHTVFWRVGHIKFFSMRTLRTMMTQAGFEVVKQEGYGRLPFLWRGMFAVAVKK